GILYELGYIRDNGNFKHQLKGNFTTPQLKTSITESYPNSDHFIQTNIGSFEYKYLRKISDNKFKIYAGGSWNNFFNIKNHYFYNNGRELGYDIFSSLDIALEVERKFENRHTLKYALSYPLLAYVVGGMKFPKGVPEEFFQRLLNEGFLDGEKDPVFTTLSSGQFQTLNTFVDLKSEFVYQYQLTQNIQLSLSYLFQFFQYPKFERVQFGSHQILAGLNFNF
ncbi:hypothetical protein, partial [Xanthovirga aplysinae]|uniref:hypothetical protein n=1 Tax=Xanthovirga aplysinae TaxID=2529853 RepID=UPI0016572622